MAVHKPLFGKVVLRGVFRTLTGLHVGAGRESVAIGALDNPVLTDPVTQQPYVPGSSLKGKLRSLLERREAKNDPGFFKRDIGRRGFPIYIHVCENKEQASECPVCRVFGSSGGRNDQGSNFPARIRVRDAYLTAYSERKLREADTDLLYTEVKYENALDRITAAANPRPVERVPAGTDFVFELVYDVENLDQLQEDLENLAYCLAVLEDDYLGGHGSRGYGKVKFLLSSVQAKRVEAYKGKADAAQEVLNPAGPEVSPKEPTEPPSDEQWKTVEDFRKAIPRIVEVFQSSPGE